MSVKILVGADYIYLPENRKVRVKSTDPFSSVSKVGSPDEAGIIWDEFWAFNHDLAPIGTLIIPKPVETTPVPITTTKPKTKSKSKPKPKQKQKPKPTLDLWFKETYKWLL